jgi:hypothetical protein
MVITGLCRKPGESSHALQPYLVKIQFNIILHVWLSQLFLSVQNSVLNAGAVCPIAILLEERTPETGNALTTGDTIQGRCCNSGCLSCVRELIPICTLHLGA